MYKYNLSVKGMLLGKILAFLLSSFGEANAVVNKYRAPSSRLNTLCKMQS